MSLAPRLDPCLDPCLDPTSLDRTEATLLLWVDRARPGSTLQGLVGLTPASVVIRSGDAALADGTVDLAAYGCAHRLTAIAFTPGAAYSSVTLAESLAGGAEYRITAEGFHDLYTIGWAARAAALTFNP